MMQDEIQENGAMTLTTKLLAICGLAAFAGLFAAAPQVLAAEDPWPALKQEAFGDRPIQTGDGMIALEIPGTADDAALVPLTVRVQPSVRQNLKSLTLFIDKNPDPKVATLHFGPAAGSGGERSFSTRVRIDDFSYVRAVLETEDGTLHMASKFVAAAGGCGAMQAKDPDTEMADLGKMLVRVFPPALPQSPIWSAQVMIKHPNANGMQLDINTANVIPARYVKEVVVKRDGELVFKMDTTFSISTNPNFRFTFGRGKDNGLDVVVTDTDETRFAAQSEPSS
jgi:sulfur-oxidizing protein SoxY